MLFSLKQLNKPYATSSIPGTTLLIPSSILYVVESSVVLHNAKLLNKKISNERECNMDYVQER